MITKFTDEYIGFTRLQCVKFSKVKDLSRSSQGHIALCLPHIHYEVTSRSWCPQGVWSNGHNGHFNLVCWYNHTLLTHWSRVTHICVGNLAIIGTDNGLSPGRRQAIIRTNAGILLIGPLGTNFSEIWIGIQTFSLKKIHLKMLSGKCRPFFLASMC